MEQKFFSEPSTFVGNVEIKVTNLERSIEFYKEVIGFQILEQIGGKVRLTADGKSAILTLVQPGNIVSKQERTTGLYHFAILLPNRVELAKIIKHLSELNVRLGASDHLVSEALYLNDPDGNGIEIYTDRPSPGWTWANNEVKMTTDPLDFQDIIKELGNENWSGLPRNTVMGHIHLHVSELEKTEEFYTKGLGFSVVCRFGSQALFISTGGYHHHIGLNTWNGVGAPAPSENSVGLEAFNLVFSKEDARERVVSQLHGLGYKVKDENGIFVSKDPSGNVIRLVV